MFIDTVYRIYTIVELGTYTENAGKKRKFEFSYAIEPVEQTEKVYIDVRAAEGCLKLRLLFLEHFVVVALIGLPAYLLIAAED